MPALPSHKKIRLHPSVYGVPGAACSITICVRDKQPCFTNESLATAAIDILRSLSERHSVPVDAYCLMPDHVHLLISPSEECDIVRFVGEFKNLTQRRLWELGGRGLMWQKSFWDHFLRADEDIEVVVRYIIDNPVRAGIVDEWERYPYSGSFVYEAYTRGASPRATELP